MRGLLQLPFPWRNSSAAAAPIAERTRGRVKFALFVFMGVYAVICVRLAQLATVPDAQVRARVDAEAALATKRPDIIDRKGHMLAADIESTSLYAEPRKMIDADEAADLISGVIPSLDADDLRKKFSSDRGFIWLKREITPRERSEIHRLGLPGVGFLTEQRRIYPNGPEVAHILGAVDVDNKGISGMEKHIDAIGDVAKTPDEPKPEPVQVSLDLAVQHAVRDELVKAVDKFKAIAASGAVMDVNTGEMIALVSLPDFDPNIPADALKPDAINRINVGVYEMGSTFKALTLAMALDSGKVRLTDTFDARAPLHYGKFRIDDFHPTRRVLTVPEVFIFSSNIGTAKIALTMGVEAHKAFLRKMGQLERLRTELPESAMPLVPARWGELNTVTISFGHGIAVAPIQTLMATAALVNGGKLIPPTFLRRTVEEANAMAKQVIRYDTSLAMRYLMRLNAEKGSAKQADIPGYRVGGKTGTAEKVVNGRYSHDKVMTAFTAVFPTDNPKYALLIVLDEPKALPETHGFRTSGWNAAPVTGKIVTRIAPLLGLEPKFDAPPNLPPAMEAHR